jgi:putative ABC transport system permease protein
MSTRLVRHSIRAVTRHRARSAFIMLGSFIGVAALTLVIAVGESAERKVLSTVRQLFGAQSIMVITGGGRFMGGARDDAARLTIEDLEAVASDVPHIEAWDPQQAMPNASIRHAGNTATARLLGASERFERVWDRSATRGETFDAEAVRGSARVALIGETVVHELFGTEDPIGSEIEIGNVPFTVIGVLEPFGTDLHGMDRDAEIVVPITTLMRRVMNVDTIAGAKLIVDDPAHVERAVEDLTRVLRERHGIPAGRPDDFHIISAVAVQQMVSKTQKVLALYLPIVAGIALLVAGIVAASLMLASVNARVSEIGLRRAVGASVEDVQLQFLVETIATILAGGIAGIVVGLAAAQWTAVKWHLDGTLSWRAVVLGIVVSAITGFLAGVLPARRAARLDPATALR